MDFNLDFDVQELEKSECWSYSHEMELYPWIVIGDSYLNKLF